MALFVWGATERRMDMDNEEYWLIDFETLRISAGSKEEAHEKALRMMYNGELPEIVFIEPDRRDPLLKFDF